MRIGIHTAVLRGEHGALPVLKVGMTTNDKRPTNISMVWCTIAPMYEAVGSDASVVRIGILILSTTKILASLFCGGDGEQCLFMPGAMRL